MGSLGSLLHLQVDYVSSGEAWKLIFGYFSYLHYFCRSECGRQAILSIGYFPEVVLFGHILTP